jgi:hypothetical protein
LEDFKYPKCSKPEPEYFNVDEYITYLSAFVGPTAKEFPVLVNKLFGLKYHWPPEVSIVNTYKDINQQLKTAVDTGDGFPEPPQNYLLYIMPGLPACQ